nr:immunoglobulin light chain junction region [Macaca mulatta]MOY04029.1 immunoglobulin light chain junction region [Macaca mulatta]
SQQYKDLLPTF